MSTTKLTDQISLGRCALFSLPALVLASLAFAATPALAETAAPQWTVSSVSRPTNFKPGGDPAGDEYVVLVTNTGGASSTGPVTISDVLPEGLSPAAGVSAVDELTKNSSGGGEFGNDCATSGEGSFSCTYSGVVDSGDTLYLRIPVTVSASPPQPRDSCAKEVVVAASALGCVTNVVRVSGGGAPAPGLMQTPTLISPEPAVFGISPGGATNALSSVQAGAHPDLTVSIAWNTTDLSGGTAGNAKNTKYVLPAGFAGDLVDTPACQASQFLDEECPVPTQVGVTTLSLDDVSGQPHLLPVYNLAPEPGEVAKIGFNYGQFYIEADVAVRPGGGPEEYGLQTTFYNLNAGSDSEIDNASITIWGVPAAAIHNSLRATPNGGAGFFFHDVSSGAIEVPYFTNPTACGGELHADFSLTSWQNPLESENPTVTEIPLGRMVGCDRLGMEPKLAAQATSDKASAASGLALNIDIPQTYGNAAGLATSTLEKQVVTLPEGMTVNPSAGAGLAACTPEQYAQEGAQYVEGQGCPKESKLGEVEIITPSLSEHAKGSVFLAQPAPFGEAGHNPFNSLLALYIVARIQNRGVLVKAPGEVEANPVTGQLVTTFDTSSASEPGGGLPPLPFSLLTFRFNQGAGAPLVTPPACGLYTVTAELTPWSWGVGSNSAPLDPFIPPFPISSAFNGGACPSGGVPPFKPQVVSGTENNVAGAYSPFYLRIVREDGEQELTKFTSIFPIGVTGNLTGIPFCPDADIEAARQTTGAQQLEDPSCPVASEIGHTLVGAGVGSLLAEAPGKIYLAGPYHGSALSVVSITAAKVGPFDLGTVVVRFALSINPVTAQVEISGAGSDPIPHIIKGIVVHVRDIRAYIDRSKFILNPTTCNPSSISETITGAGQNPANPADQMTVGASAPFQAADCANLKFTPMFKVSTSGKTSRSQGASLHVDLTYPTGALGTQANIKEVKVDLPKQLPSRLTTLQKACTAAQFSANPAGCPAPSIIGYAKAVTPLIPVPLEGPAYFVSHGGEAFPELEIVLQGYGFTIVLTGNTFISKAGITSSTFKTVPDQPVGSFELTLPEGKYSALAANGNLCAVTKTVTVKKKVTVKVKGKKKTVTRNVKQTQAASLAMPTEFTAQNGAVIHQSTPVSVTGCAKVKKAKAKKAKGGKGAKKKR
jgi:hypothetical protein